MKHIGLLFGTFNPIHIGHLIVANVMLESTDMSKIWFVVTPQNPFKKRSTLLHEFDRLEMVRAAVYDNYSMEASDIEFQLPKPSYTIDTLVHLSEKYPDKKFSLIIGEDNLAGLNRWKNSEQMLKNFSLYVYPRPKSSESDLRNHPSITMVEAPEINVSASFIRKFVKEGRSIQYMVPQPVIDMIRDKGFYS